MKHFSVKSILVHGFEGFVGSILIFEFYKTEVTFRSSGFVIDDTRANDRTTLLKFSS